MKQTDRQTINYKHHIDKTWCVEDQPAEKLLSQGVKGVTDTELVAVILNGTPNASEIARTIYSQAENNLTNLSHLSIDKLIKVKGVTRKKAAAIAAAFELGRRCANHVNEKIPIKSSETVKDIMSPLIADLEHEEFWLLCLNRANRLIGRYKISQGGLSGTIIDTRIILKKALDTLASSMIVCHNHPSGNKQPSDADIKITEKLNKAAEHMEIKLLDHVIVSTEGHFSFADEGLL